MFSADVVVQLRLSGRAQTLFCSAISFVAHHGSFSFISPFHLGCTCGQQDSLVSSARVVRVEYLARQRLGDEDACICLLVAYCLA